MELQIFALLHGVTLPFVRKQPICPYLSPTPFCPAAKSTGAGHGCWGLSSL